MKTHRGLAKRVKVTGTGPRARDGGTTATTKRMKKRSEKLYGLRGMQPVDGTHAKRVKRLLPYHNVR